MGWKTFVGLRYLTRRRREKFISIISIISILGVIVGVAALIVVISIMTGFDTEIRDKIIGTYSHIVILKRGGMGNEARIMEIAERHEHIIASSPFIDEPAFLKHGDGIVGVLLRGLDVQREPSVSNVKEFISTGTLYFGDDGVIMGRELAKTLNLKKGDAVTLHSPYANKTFPFSHRKKEFTIVGMFTSGRYDYDANMVFMDIEQ